MELQDLLDELNADRTIVGGSPLHAEMPRTSQEALKITGELNGGYHEPERVLELLSGLTGTTVDESAAVFPPLHSDFGKNLRLGRRDFLNSACRFQDQGEATIGQNSVFAATSLVTKDVPANTIVVRSPRA